MTYCVRTDVEMHTRRWLPGGFTAATKPRDSDVDAFVASIAAELDAAMAADGITVPVTNATAVALLKHYNSIGAAAMAADVMFPETTGEGSSGRSARLWAVYDKGLDKLSSADNPVAQILAQALDPAKGRAPISDYTESPDQSLRTPFFTRDKEY